jgi:hypothetical protein
VPGPGNYDVGESIRRHGPKFGRARRQDLNEQLAEDVPGPGAYKTPTVPANAPTAPRIR